MNETSAPVNGLPACRSSPEPLRVNAISLTTPTLLCQPIQKKKRILMMRLVFYPTRLTASGIS